MTRSYATTPMAFKTAVERRLRDEVAATGMDLNRRRQLLVFDRFLVRLFRVLDRRVVLKGGLVLELRLDRARTTRDVDLRVVGSPDDVLTALQDAGRLELGDFLRFEVVEDPRHPRIEAEGMTYEGLRYRAQAHLAARPYGVPFGIDVAFAEPMDGVPDEVQSSRFLGFAGVASGCIRVYPLETHIAEKLHAYTLPRQRANSRVKDLPDIALLSTAADFDSRVLRSAIDRTFQHRATHPVPSRLPEPASAWAPVYARMTLKDGLPWPSLSDVTAAARAFLDPVLAGGSGHWDAGAGAWVPSEGEE